ncbi:hypothetical protein AX16_007286 [Volvariella volvacea WC 439]|nr:hypothetical protein AX16_007286 [Volvariella volvacea WC 439]
MPGPRNAKKKSTKSSKASQKPKNATNAQSSTVGSIVNDALEKLRKKRLEQREAQRKERYQYAEEMRLKAQENLNDENLEDALRHCRIAESERQNDLRILSLLAEIHQKMNHYEETIALADRVLFENPDNTDALYFRAKARMDDPDAFEEDVAKRDLLRILELDPNHELAKEALEDLKDVKVPEDDDGQSLYGRLVTFDIQSESDTSDCHQVGNGVACRFYNRNGCNRGSNCRFSHAPDERSIRDELGQNVCIYYLVDECKFGSKCNYSHRKTYLPVDGWWNDPKRVEGVKLSVLINNYIPDGEDAWENVYDMDEEMDEEMQERSRNMGFTNAEVEELLAQGVKPWDDDAWESEILV